MSFSSSAWRLAIALPVIIACDQEPRQPVIDSTAPAVTQVNDSTVPTSSRSTWNPSLGPILVVSGGQRDANVVFPGFSDSTLTDTTTFDTSGLAGMQVDLFSRAGMTGRGHLQTVAGPTRSDGCLSWPDAIITVDSAAPNSAWTIAFAANHVRPVPLDSIESFTRADSTRLTVDVARMASVIPDDTATAFRGIPFFVRQIRRFQTEPQSRVLVASVTRRLNQEANPLEEQLLLVAERSDSTSAGRWVPVYYERVSGQEETIETTDVLAAVMLGEGETPAIVLIRDYGDGSAYSLLTRARDGVWRISWSSAYAGC